MHAISVIIPSYDGANWLPKTLDKLKISLQNAHLYDHEIIVVNDGSTDDTEAVLAELSKHDKHLIVINQENKGRFLARKAGIKRASKEFVLFLDCRVYVDEQSLSYVKEEMAKNPKLLAWNGHVRIKLGWNIFARFWDAVTFVAWRRYLGNPRLVQYGLDDFDYYPKGTGFFLAPRVLLEKYIDAFKTNIDDLKFVSDDTALLRGIADEVKITIAPGFSCLYHSRDKFSAFLKHTLNRGTFFVDGFFQPGNRFFVLLLAFLVISPLSLIALSVWPQFIIGLFLTGWLLGLMAAFIIGVPTASALSLWLLSPVFALLYGIGIWRGVLMIALQKLNGKKTAV